MSTRLQKFQTLDLEPMMRTSLEMLVVMHGGLSEVGKAGSLESAQTIADQTLQEIQRIAFSNGGTNAETEQ
jgi:hypothetical protein